MSSDPDKIKRHADLQTSQYDGAWLKSLDEAEEENKKHFWYNNPRQLISNNSVGPGSLVVGNGADIYLSTLLPALETAEQEIIFVTCFWARSQCLNQLGEILIKISQKARTRPIGTPKLRVRLCFSSRSIIQKLFHTSSPDGHIYKPSQWVSKLGLPEPERLSELDLQVKSLFFLPFSVMHPKFVIIDRKYALLPSCNLSYESWFEGCLSLNGPVVESLLLFWKETWGKNDLPTLAGTTFYLEETASTLGSPHTITLLPSPHHRSPRFRPFLSVPAPPQTPLIAYLNNRIATAKSSIKILTPNLTCQHIILSLLAALFRGVEVTIITNRRMMVLEQILTSGTVTEICVWRLKRRYRRLQTAQNQTRTENTDLERGPSTRQTGLLQIGYFRPSTKYAKSHLKCTIIDEKTVVMGSGNMDRASWYTSQELGVAVGGGDFVKEVWGKVEGGLERGGGGEGGLVEWVEWV